MEILYLSSCDFNDEIVWVGHDSPVVDIGLDNFGQGMGMVIDMKGSKSFMIGNLPIQRVFSHDFFNDNAAIVDKVGEKIVLPLDIKEFDIESTLFFKVEKELLQELATRNKVKIVRDPLFQVILKIPVQKLVLVQKMVVEGLPSNLDQLHNIDDGNFIKFHFFQ